MSINCRESVDLHPAIVCVVYILSTVKTVLTRLMWIPGSSNGTFVLNTLRKRHIRNLVSVRNFDVLVHLVDLLDDNKSVFGFRVFSSFRVSETKTRTTEKKKRKKRNIMSHHIKDEKDRQEHKHKHFYFHHCNCNHLQQNNCKVDDGKAAPPPKRREDSSTYAKEEEGKSTITRKEEVEQQHPYKEETEKKQHRLQNRRRRQHHPKGLRPLLPCGLMLLSPFPLPPCGRCSSCHPLLVGGGAFFPLILWVVVLSSLFPFGVVRPFSRCSLSLSFWVVLWCALLSCFFRVVLPPSLLSVVGGASIPLLHM